MKDLREHIVDAMVANLTESIASSKILDVFTRPDSKLCYQFRNWLSRGIQWDKITDDDIEELSCEDARNLAYKRNSNDYILWLDENGKFIARSVGNYMILFEPMDYNLRRDNRRVTVNSLSHFAKKAYLIPSEFDTRELRRQRDEQKRGALALMDDAKIAKENMKRYRDIIADRKANELNLGDVVERITNTLDKFKTLIKNITDDAVSTSDFSKAYQDFTNIQNNMSSIMNRFHDVLYSEDKSERYKEYGKEIADKYRREVVNDVERLDAAIDKFNDEYTE